jgi:tRNA 2-thiouridine synthesizing protein A
LEGIVVTAEVDARGSQCPGPLMELIRLVRAASVGDVLAVVSTEAGTARDLPAWAAKAGHAYLGSEPALGAVRYMLRKAR